MSTTTEQMVVIESDGVLTVEDAEGGRWWPSEEAQEEIEASDEPADAALRICREQPTRGTWRS